MGIQLRHTALRNMSPMLRELDDYLALHRIGFALSDPDGLLFAVNSLFVEQSGDFPLQTTPLSEILRFWHQKRGASPDRILDEWLAPPPLRQSGAWNGRLPLEKSPRNPMLELFRIPLSLSQSGILYLFQTTHSEALPSLIEHFQILRKSFQLILLDLLDYAVLLAALHDTRSPDRCDSVLLSTTARFQSGSSFLHVERENPTPLHKPSGPVLRSTLLSKNPPHLVVRRGYFSRQELFGPLTFHLPLFAESSFYGWALFALSKDTNRKQLIRSKTSDARALSEALHRIRLDLFLAPLLEKHPGSGFYSERGIQQILQDLMSPEGTAESFALVGLSLESTDGEAPLIELLSRFSRKMDLTGRLSTREYVLVLMDAGQGRAGKALERLKEVLEEHARKDYRIRLSLGMTIFPGTENTPVRMIRSAFFRTTRVIGGQASSAR